MSVRRLKAAQGFGPRAKISSLPQRGPKPCAARRGSVLVIVLWVCIGLIALALYFANSMSSELRAADNRLNEAAARQALEGGIRYANFVLTNYGMTGNVPHIEDYHAEAMPVGDAKFWFIGRDNDQPSNARNALTAPTYALVDESSKLNLNTATRAMLEALPNMTPELADAIFSWARANAGLNSNADASYAQLTPARRNKGAPFETTDEVRLVYGATLDLLLGEDTNRNGVLDANEDDGEQTAPRDNQDGQLLAGLLEYVTVYSRLPAQSASGQRRVNIRTPQTRGNLPQMLQRRGIAGGRVGLIMQRAGNNEFDSVMAFFLETQMTAEEFALVHTDLTATQQNNGTQQGLINVNTASETVLACIPGIGIESAATLVAYRQQHPEGLTSFAWLRDLIRPADLRRAGPFITDHSYQFSADIAAVGNNGRGYCREKVVFDTTGTAPRIVYRQDLSAFGWALGAEARRSLRANPNDS